MAEKKKVVVAGLGEVGKPIFELASRQHETLGVDVEPPPAPASKADVLHVCYPFQIADFVGETARYIELFRPELTIVNSTVAIGTTRAIAQRTGAAVAYSPVRGKHVRMLDDLLKYTKFVGALEGSVASQASQHFQSLGMKTRILSSPEVTELAKLCETTHFGLLIAWAQEIERYCDQLGADYEEAIALFDEVAYLPQVKFFPGPIGGHCVMPNIEILGRLQPSELLKAVQSSNRKKVERENKGKAAPAGRMAAAPKR
jgi:UDP-N-acetyl-D-mannosaminuronate dehydrogenase